MAFPNLRGCWCLSHLPGQAFPAKNVEPLLQLEQGRGQAGLSGFVVLKDEKERGRKAEVGSIHSHVEGTQR
jgi:hypothetical protein